MSLRYKLILGKFRVTHVVKTANGLRFRVEFPGLGGLLVPLPSHADVRENDLITLYAEVPLNAPSFSPPIQ